MTIYVSNFSFHMNNNELNQLFAVYGEVESVKVITDRSTQKSKGFGFVEMKDDSAGNEAIAKLNGLIVEGRTLVVNLAHAREKGQFSPMLSKAE